MHSFLAKGRLLYTHDETITDLCAQTEEIGERDTGPAPATATGALPPITRPTNGSSPAATSTTRRSGSSTPRPRWRRSRSSAGGLLADREVIPQAMKLNPAFFKTVYTDLLNGKKTRKNVQAAWTRSTATWRSAPRRCSDL